MQKTREIIERYNTRTVRWVLLTGVVVIGVIVRFLAMARGYNFDFESYKIVGDIMVNGGNVYAETTRYNYGPIWFTILGIFREVGSLFANPDIIFRSLIVGLLTAVDLAIALVLKKRFGVWAFVLFFLNPVSIIISGYHNQFDSIAILIGLLGLAVYEKANPDKLDRNHVYAALLIGLSLMTKHIFFFLPVWLFLRAKTLRTKLFILFAPVALFALAFLPFWPNGHQGIIQNVFLYKSFANAPLLHSFVSPGIQALVSPAVVLFIALLFVGFLTRKLPPVVAGLWYLITLVAFSPAIANQYLAIAMPAVIVLGPIFFLPFIGFATILLALTSQEGLYIVRFIDNIPLALLPYVNPDGFRGEYNLMITCLFLGAIATWIYRYKRHWFANTYRLLVREITRQYKQLTS